MNINKKFLNIREVAKITGIKEHVIRYWDSIDPKTNRLRISGISTKTRKGTRYFDKDNIERLERLKDLLYDNGQHLNTLTLADKFLVNKKNKFTLNLEKSENTNYPENIKKIKEILKNIRKIVN